MTEMLEVSNGDFKIIEKNLEKKIREYSSSEIQQRVIWEVI